MSLILKSPDVAMFGTPIVSGSIDLDSVFTMTTAGRVKIDVPGGLDFAGGFNSYYNYANNWCGGLTSTSDMTVSFWIKPDLVASEITYLIESGAGGATRQFITVEANSSTQLRIFIRHTTNGSQDGITYASSYGSVTNGAWNHIVYGYDYSANNLEVAINDTDQSASNQENGTNTFPGTTTADTYLGVLNQSSNYYDGCLTEFWMDDTYYDVSVESNRRNFIDSDGYPVELPSSPLVYLNGTKDFNWVNSGTYNMGARNFNNLSDCADSPSD